MSSEFRNKEVILNLGKRFCGANRSGWKARLCIEGADGTARETERGAGPAGRCGALKTRTRSPGSLGVLQSGGRNQDRERGLRQRSKEGDPRGHADPGPREGPQDPSTTTVQPSVNREGS